MDINWQVLKIVLSGVLKLKIIDTVDEAPHFSICKTLFVLRFYRCGMLVEKKSSIFVYLNASLQSLYV